MTRGLLILQKILRGIGREIVETIRFGALRIDAAGYRQHDADAVIAIVGELQGPAPDAEEPEAREA